MLMEKYFLFVLMFSFIWNSTYKDFHGILYLICPGRKKNLKIETDVPVSVVEVWGWEAPMSAKINLSTSPFTLR